MSEKKHTPGRLTIAYPEVASGAPILISGGTVVIAGEIDTRENAEHLQLCWNVCSTVPNPKAIKDVIEAAEKAYWGWKEGNDVLGPMQTLRTALAALNKETP